MKKGRYRRVLAASAGVALTLPASGFAQATASSDVNGERPELIGGDIVVTARKRDERLIDTPIAISAFTSERLEALGADSPNEFLNKTSGVYFRSNTTAGTSFINIRGVTGSRNAESSVAVVVDGVYLNNPLSFNNQLIDLQQIEVLKGPQGALYGRNASAGAINITTKAPSNDFEGKVNVGIGRHLWRKANVIISGPLIEDKLLFRAVAYHSGSDGFLRNEFRSTPGNPVYGDKQSDTGGRLRVLYTPNELLTVDLRGSVTETSGGFNTTVGFFDPLAATGNEDYVLGPLRFESSAPGFTNRKTRDASLKIDYELGGGGSITSITAYSKLDEKSGGDGQPVGRAATTFQTLTNQYETVSQELRYTSPSDRPFRYIFGGYYQKTDRLFSVSGGTNGGNGIVINRNPLPSNDPRAVTTSLSADDISQKVWSVFGQVQYDLSDQIELSLDLRYDRDKERATNVAPIAFQNPAFVGQVRRLTFQRLQPRASISYKASSDLAFYASYAEGFKNGGFNPSGARATALLTNPNTVIQDEFNSEIAKTAEVGVKSKLFDDRLSLNAAGYWTRIAGSNYFDFVLEAFSQVNLNIDKIEIFGLEFDASLAVTNELTVGINGNVVNNKIKELRFRPAFVGNRSPAFPLSDFTTDVQYRHQFNDRYAIFARADMQFRGPIYWDLGNTVRGKPEKFINARAGFDVANTLGKKLRFEVFCDNCTNNNQIIESLVLADLGTSVHFTARNARIVGLEASIEY